MYMALRLSLQMTIRSILRAPCPTLSAYGNKGGFSGWIQIGRIKDVTGSFSKENAVAAGDRI